MRDARRTEEELRELAGGEGVRALLRIAVDCEARAAANPMDEAEWLLLAGAALDCCSSCEDEGA